MLQQATHTPTDEVSQKHIFNLNCLVVEFTVIEANTINHHSKLILRCGSRYNQIRKNGPYPTELSASGDKRRL
jgi:hypothetical protein